MKLGDVCAPNGAISQTGGCFTWWIRQYSACATQSANQGIEQKTMTLTLEPNRSVSSCLLWLLSSSCLECDSDNNEVWKGMFSFFFHLSFARGRIGVFQRGGELNSKQSGLPVHVSLTNLQLYDHSFHLFSVGEHLLLSLWWLCEELLRYKNTVYWVEWIYLSIASLCNVGDNVYFSTDLLKSLPV